MIKRLRLIIIFSQLAVSCFNPSQSTQLPPSSDQEKQQTKNWQKINLILTIDTSYQAKEDLIGFDEILPIFTSRSEYGPCASCHSYEWPYLSELGWPKFLQSLNSSQNEIKTLEELAKLLVACVDQDNEEHCAGDPKTKEDNLDYKMPSKYGYDPISENDLSLLKKWLADGTKEQSTKNRQPLVNRDGLSLAILSLSSKKIDFRPNKTDLLPLGENYLQVDLEFRLLSPCQTETLRFQILDRHNQEITTFSATFDCINQALSANRRI